MHSITIKTNNSQTINYLKNKFNKINLNDVFFSCQNFKHFTNIIIHYKGKNTEEFIQKISKILSFLVIYEFEENFLKQIISKEYFYFPKLEQKCILEKCFNIMIDSDSILKNKFDTLFKSFENYLKYEKKLYLFGFINFRLKSYINILEKVISEAVNNFIIEKEYNEFISLLKLYINCSNSNSDQIHLIYSKSFTILLDKDKNIIENYNNTLNAKFLSDISFSKNDYTLNTLLNLLPKKVYIHLIDNNEDEFINTLKLIFEKKLEICNNCNICNFYKNAFILK